MPSAYQLQESRVMPAQRTERYEYVVPDTITLEDVVNAAFYQQVAKRYRVGTRLEVRATDFAWKVDVIFGPKDDRGESEIIFERIVALRRADGASWAMLCERRSDPAVPARTTPPEQTVDAAGLMDGEPLRPPHDPDVMTPPPPPKRRARQTAEPVVEAD